MINEVIYMAIQVIYSACQEKKSVLQENWSGARVIILNCQDILSQRHGLGSMTEF